MCWQALKAGILNSLAHNRCKHCIFSLRRFRPNQPRLHISLVLLSEARMCAFADMENYCEIEQNVKLNHPKWLLCLSLELVLVLPSIQLLTFTGILRPRLCRSGHLAVCAREHAPRQSAPPPAKINTYCSDEFN